MVKLNNAPNKRVIGRKAYQGEWTIEG